MNSAQLGSIAASDEDMATEEYLRRVILDYRQMKHFAADPLIVDAGEGIRFRDVNGKWYIDGLSGIWVTSLGHQNKRMIEAMKRQLDSYVFWPTMHSANPPEVRLANLLAEIAPGDLNRAMILGSGSEATEVAMKMAKQYHKVIGHHRKYKIFSFYVSYHGATFGAMAATGQFAHRKYYEPLMEGFIHVHSHNCYRCPFDQRYPDCEILCAKVVERTIEREDSASIAGMIVEPIINIQGIVTPPPEYLPMLRDICTRHDIVLIYDEIITGFGRTGELFAANTFDAIPDIICCGKGMSGGYAPVAACIAHEKIGEAFWGDDPAIAFAHGHTFGGNMLSAGVAIEAICELLDRDLPANAKRLEPYVKAKLRRLDDEYGIIGDIRGRGLMIGAELVKDKATKERFPEERAIGSAIARACLRNGLLLRSEAHWFAIAPPLTVTEDEIDEAFGVLEVSMGEVLEQSWP
jgi:adenosylmethionine-8-amino-7-oxononanoate aminotransferase